MGEVPGKVAVALRELKCAMVSGGMGAAVLRIARPASQILAIWKGDLEGAGGCLANSR
jgi:hypothetical protein